MPSPALPARRRRAGQPLENSLEGPRLLAPQLVVGEAASDQRLMGSDLGDAALVDDDDRVRARYEGQPVRDDHDRPAA